MSCDPFMLMQDTKVVPPQVQHLTAQSLHHLAPALSTDQPSGWCEARAAPQCLALCLLPGQLAAKHRRLSLGCLVLSMMPAVAPGTFCQCLGLYINGQASVPNKVNCAASQISFSDRASHLQSRTFRLLETH